MLGRLLTTTTFFFSLLALFCTTTTGVQAVPDWVVVGLKNRQVVVNAAKAAVSDIGAADGGVNEEKLDKNLNADMKGVYAETMDCDLFTGWSGGVSLRGVSQSECNDASLALFAKMGVKMVGGTPAY